MSQPVVRRGLYEADYEKVDRNWPERNGIAAGTLANELNKDSYPFTITDKTTGLSKQVSMKSVDSRSTLAITAGETALTYESKESVSKETVVADVIENVTITSTDPKTKAQTNVQVSESYLHWDKDFTWPADAQSDTFKVTVYVNGAANATYQNAPKAEITVNCVDTTILYTVKYLDGYSAENNVVAEYTVAENKATTQPANPVRELYNFTGWTPAVADTVTGDATYKATWKPNLDNNKNDVADQEETYIVIYTDGVEDEEIFADAEHENIAYGDDTPAAPGNSAPCVQHFGQDEEGNELGNGDGGHK